MVNRFKRKTVIIVCVCLTILIGTGMAIYFSLTKDTVAPLTGIDLKTAEIYSQLYQTSVEKVSELKRRTDSWDQVSEALAKEKYNLPQEKREALYKEGYSMVDMDQADSLALQTGVDPLLIIEARGKIGSTKKWNEVKKELKIDEKIRQANESVKKLSKEDQ